MGHLHVVDTVVVVVTLSFINSILSKMRQSYPEDADIAMAVIVAFLEVMRHLVW